VVIKQHRNTTHRFTVIFEKEDDGGYHVFCPTLPGCHTQSESIDEGLPEGILSRKHFAALWMTWVSLSMNFVR
jgi:hypothetical protein